MAGRRLTCAIATIAVASYPLLSAGTPATARPSEGFSARLERAALLTGIDVTELRRRMSADVTLGVTEEGRLHYTEPAANAAEAEAPAPEPQAVTSLASTFTLHSNPGATYTILLDFDGERVAGTGWNSAAKLPAMTHPAWDPAGDGPAFSASERTLVQDVWRRVAEDYAPFDVDVTTEDPGAAGLERGSSADTTYGVRMLISPSDTAVETLCTYCGGIAFMDVFDMLNNAYRIGWVFPQALYDNPKYIADAAAHEAGHTLGLAHDGHGSDAYYEGHDAWGPIMGAGYLRPVTQFSKGDYAKATNTEDDLAILTGLLGQRPDEAGTGIADAAPLGSGAGIITNRKDKDTYALGTCTGPLTVTAVPGETGANLDIELTLLDAAGAVVDSDDPAVVRRSTAQATGLDAEVGVGSATGAYYVRVDGVGHGTATTGYNDYGSIGAYQLTVDGTCADSTDPVDPTDPGVEEPAEETDGTGTAATTQEVAGATITLSAPRRARAGTRPRVVVEVERTATDGVEDARGQVRFRLGKRTVRTVRLSDGTARIRLPRLARSRPTQVLRATYRGNALTESARAHQRLRILRRR
ncbi:hypothetical protein [Nocardioides sp. YIM 152588]|uniref:hypothetical protein n=1 Tax=Nocardioides sp. YIM 152588 TaxID=3158259 RepID=UPI0032E53003